jgi:hypothetical protein
VPSSFSAGGRADNFTVTLRNNTNSNQVAITVNFAVQLNGLTASQLRIRSGIGGDLATHDAGGNMVVATDPRSHDFGPKGTVFGRETQISYTIEFLAGTPSGKATLTASAVKQGNQFGSASDSITIKGGAAASPTPDPSSAAPTDTATDPAVGGPSGGQAVPTQPLSDKNAIPDSGGGVPVVLYVMGALLLGVGGVILYMLFRQRQPAAAVADTPPGEFDRPASLGYPAGRASAKPPVPVDPTTPMPSLRVATMPNPQVPRPGPSGPRPGPVGPVDPPPVDPWEGRPPGRHSSD